MKSSLILVIICLHLYYLEAPIKLPAGNPLLKKDKVCVS